MSEFLQHVERSIQNRRLLASGQKILVAVSGGVDSMVLLHAMNSLAERSRWQISVAHFNHQLRGRSSNADEKLVRQTTAALKLPFDVECADVKAFAKKSKLSVEMAARKLRHDFFASVARNRKISTVALAHHADDQVELFFLRLLRGAGGEGLAGMKWHSPSPADTKLMLVRPLLDVTKAELLGFARQNKITSREDATNASLDFLRNRIRNELLPLLQKHYQPGLATSVLRAMDIVGAESEFTGEVARAWFRRGRGDESQIKSGKRKTENGNKSGTPYVVSRDFEDLSVAVQRRVLQSQLMALGLDTDFRLIESLRQGAGVAVSISRDLSVSRNQAGVVKLKSQPPAGFRAGKRVVKLSGGAGEVFFDSVRVNWSLDARTDFKRRRGDSACEFFDAGKIGSKIILRHWRPGDRFQPIGLKSSVKLQDLFTNAKIPREQRHRLLVAATADGEIFWVEGLRISEGFKLTSQTQRRLIWRWQRLEQLNPKVDQ